MSAEVSKDMSGIDCCEDFGGLIIMPEKNHKLNV